MAILLTSINPRNIKAVHTKTGSLAYPTAIADLGGGTFQYSIERVWSATDAGQWNVLVNTSNPVMNDKGSLVPEQQIGTFTVLIESTAVYNFVMPWDRLFQSSIKPDLLHIESVNLPDDSPMWRSWLHRETINNKISLTYYIRSIADNAAIPIWRDPEYSDAAAIVPSHANAVAISDTEFRQNLIPGVSLIYAPKRDLAGQVGIRLFTTGATFSSVNANALDIGGALTGGWVRSLTDFTGEVITITPPAQAVKIRISFARPNNTTDIYEFPIT